MYLTEAQLAVLLNTPFFNLPVTENEITYAFYRGHVNATVHTLRFNWTNQFNETFMIQHIIRYLMARFPLNTTLLGSINYDVLLVNPDSEPTSYYVWRANSNARHFDENNENLIMLTYNNLYRFIAQATSVHTTTLDLMFSSSNVRIQKILSIVFSFVEI